MVCNPCDPDKAISLAFPISEPVLSSASSRAAVELAASSRSEWWNRHFPSPGCAHPGRSTNSKQNSRHGRAGFLHQPRWHGVRLAAAAVSAAPTAGQREPARRPGTLRERIEEDMAGILLERRVSGGSHEISSVYRAAAPTRRKNHLFAPISMGRRRSRRSGRKMPSRSVHQPLAS